MRTAVLLTGLQRNSSHFVANLLGCLIDINDCDVFIYTADDSKVRREVGREIRILNMRPDDDFCDEDGLRKRYGEKVKGVKVDRGNAEMNEFMSLLFPDDGVDVKREKHMSNGRDSHVLECNKNIVSQFFKVRQAVLMMEEYERANGFKYDYVLRLRMDSFFGMKVSLDMVAKMYDMRSVALSPRLANDFKRNNCDSLVFIKRDYAHILKDFVMFYASRRNYSEIVVPEEELFLFVEGHGLKMELGKGLGYRAGSYVGRARDIPFFRRESIPEINKRMNFYSTPFRW